MLRFALTAVLLATPAVAGPLPFGDGRWELDPGAKVERFEGRDVLAIENGWARRKDVRLEDGTLDVDVRVTRRRSFVYVAFRIAGEGENEEVYLRPHKSGLPDALQYAPVWQGHSAWQLHHGPGGTAAIEFQPDVWTHLRLVLQGSQAALFLGDMQTPALLVPRLAREPRAGSIALRAFVPPGTPGEGPAVRYADVVVRPGAAPYAFPAPPAAAAAEPGLVRSWAVSRAWADAKETLRLPAAETLGDVRELSTEPGGLLELHRHVALPAGSRAATALARVHVRAGAAGLRAFDLGYSDVATVFLNGRPLFRADDSYSFDRPRRDGLIGLDQARLYLPLEAGDNELAVVLSDSFGGWGLMGRFPDSAGLELSAR